MCHHQLLVRSRHLRPWLENNKRQQRQQTKQNKRMCLCQSCGERCHSCPLRLFFYPLFLFLNSTSLPCSTFLPFPFPFLSLLLFLPLLPSLPSSSSFSSFFFFFLFFSFFITLFSYKLPIHSPHRRPRFSHNGYNLRNSHSGINTHCFLER